MINNRQKFYDERIAEGMDPKLADMLANQCPPGGLTDNTFLAGQGTLDQQFKDDPMLEVVVENARKRGYNPSPNDTYLPSIADDIGDPLAFVPAGSARSHIKKVLELRNLAGVGVVNRKRIDTPPSPIVELGEKICRREVAAMRKDALLRGDKHTATQDYKSLRAEVINRNKRKPHLPS